MDSCMCGNALLHGGLSIVQSLLLGRRGTFPTSRYHITLHCTAHCTFALYRASDLSYIQIPYTIEIDVPRLPLTVQMTTSSICDTTTLPSSQISRQITRKIELTSFQPPVYSTKNFYNNFDLSYRLIPFNIVLYPGCRFQPR